MEINGLYRLAPLVSYNDYDGYGYLLDIRQGVLEELNEHDTHILSALLKRATAREAALQINSKQRETDVATLLNRLEQRGFLEAQADKRQGSVSLPVEICTRGVHPFDPPTLRQRIVGCRLTHKFAKKGRYASEEENGEDMCQI